MNARRQTILTIIIALVLGLGGPFAAWYMKQEIHRRDQELAQMIDEVSRSCEEAIRIVERIGEIDQGTALIEQHRAMLEELAADGIYLVIDRSRPVGHQRWKAWVVAPK